MSHLFSSQITICEDNVQALLPAARMLQLDYVVDQCGTFLEEHLSTQNCLGFYLFAGMFGHFSTRILAFSLTVVTVHCFFNSPLFISYRYFSPDKHNCEQLLNTARLFIQRNFESVVAKGEEFRQLQPPHIIEVMGKQC